MVDGSAIPVIAGLTIGITIVVLFSSMLKPVYGMTDDELRRLVSDQYPQFQALKERYPNTTVERIERYERAIYFHYEATKDPRDDSILSFPGPTVLALTLEIQPLSGRALYAICGSGLSKPLAATIQIIRTTDCLETSSGEGVSPDSSGDELSGGNLVPDNRDKIDLTIIELKDAYRQGEKIIFSVSAKGVSDNACNIDSPSVSLRDDGNEKTINWPLSFGFNTALMCGGSEPLDKKWTFGDEPENEIVLDTPGLYIIVASIEDITTEKKFIVTG
jgi:hypothetical protein